MAASKKPGLLAIIAGGKPGEEDAESGDKPLDAKKRALQDMFSAAKAGDWDGAAMAFKDAYDACAGAHDEDENEGGGMEY